MNDFRLVDPAYVEAHRRNAVVLEAHFSSLDHPLTDCGTGWRSSVSFLIARLLGLRAKNYDDGFYGWSSAPVRACASSSSSSSSVTPA